MIILITGATHTGKTLLAGKLSQKYNYPYISLDLLKMGLMRSGKTNLRPTDADEDITEYLWPIVREMIKTAMENEQDLIIEGCYIPFDWMDDMPIGYIGKIKYICLIMSEQYINTHFDDIIKYENVAEKRMFPESVIKPQLIAENNYNLEMCLKYGLKYILIDKDYEL
ncbi:MAG: adenylate kinase [Eubacteriaceae bacterium]|nr:adenylate kinase [Eubacteriaceae bacterium]